MTLTKTQESEVTATIQAYATAYQKKDIKTLSAIFSPDISGFGSGPDEVISNHKDFIRQMKRDLIQATVLSVEFFDRKIAGDGRVAWTTSKSTITFTVDGSRKQTLHGRSTMVLRNTGSRWIIEQLHFSLPYGEQSEGQSFPGA
ncbi:nuclear transport factor 2 family protein [uncultured Methanoregula sp.]|uniref:nuclear transport factor 2 family protein n=1 Tax=uncultured Methanoregula sp. TaxID=1005933 RepID=UPI002AAAA3C2|nr:nuclear transport factor 2 family protein [uncultured Methanoregula sp.]